MKVFLYTENEKLNRKSGLGKAIKHQQKALDSVGVEYTLNPKDDYDILHINTWFIKSYFVAKKAKKNGKKIVYHAHSTEEDYKNGFIFANQTSKIIKWWLIKCYSLGDVIITPTPYSKRLLEGYGIKKPIYAVSNGIELDLFKKDKKSGVRFRETYGISDDQCSIIGIGLYIKRKGILDFFELARRFPQYRFIWFGYSPVIAGGISIIKAFRHIPKNVTLAGYVDSDMIKSALNGCDLYLFPTLEETEGIPIVEACACKTHAIIRDIPVFSDWLEDGVNVYKAKDVDEFEEKIKKYFNGQLKDVTKKGYDVAQERDIKSIGIKLKEIYKSIL